MKKTTKSKSKHLVYYIINSSPHYKVFTSERVARKFVKDFLKKYPDPNDGYWVDFLVTDILGEIEILDNTLSDANVADIK